MARDTSSSSNQETAEAGFRGASWMNCKTKGNGTSVWLYNLPGPVGDGTDGTCWLGQPPRGDYRVE